MDKSTAMLGDPNLQNGITNWLSHDHIISISIYKYIYLVGGFKHVLFFHNIWDNPSH